VGQKSIYDIIAITLSTTPPIRTLDIRHTTFKRHLKTFLFKSAFSDC